MILTAIRERKILKIQLFISNLIDGFTHLFVLRCPMDRQKDMEPVKSPRLRTPQTLGYSHLAIKEPPKLRRAVRCKKMLHLSKAPRRLTFEGPPSQR